MDNALIYISGPISGLPQVPMDEKLARFARAEEWLSGQPWVAGVVNPLNVQACCPSGDDPKCNAEGHIGQDGLPLHAWHCYLRHDIGALLPCTHIALLPQWQMSRGARLERMIAAELGMEIIHLNAQGTREWHGESVTYH